MSSSSCLRFKTLIVIFLFTSVLSAFAFEGFSDDSGSHMESVRTALASVYRTDSHPPELIKTMPIFGLKTYQWQAYTPASLLSDASRDVDSYYFGIIYAHAQTASFNYKKDLNKTELQQIEEDALFAYIKHMGTWLADVRSRYAQAKGDPAKLREATYLLGVLLHSYQDLWAHHGITNEMHKAMLTHEGIDVDRDPERILQMREHLASLLADLPMILGPEAGPVFLEYLRSNKEIKAPSTAERKKILGRGRDIFIQGILYVVFTSDTKKSLHYRDELEWDVDALDLLFHDQEGLTAAVAFSTPKELAAYLVSRGYRF